MSYAMKTKTINLGFDGYWPEPNVGGMPATSGVYCVYTCTYDARAQTVSIHKLIYVGEGANVRARVDGHECWPIWRNELTAGQVLCLSAAAVSPTDRHRAEAAIIFKHKPKCNKEYLHSFPFDATTISVVGKTAQLIPNFTVLRTER